MDDIETQINRWKGSKFDHDYTKKVANIQCKICSLEYPFENGTVEHHLREHHPGISLKDYFQACVLKNVVKVNVNDCCVAGIVPEGTKSRYSQRLLKKASKKCTCCTKRTLKRKIASFSEKYAQNSQQEPVAKKPRKKRRNMSKRSNSKYPYWLDKCQYRCHSCKLRFTSNSHCYIHCVNKHQSTIVKMINEKKLSRTVTRYHECFLCKIKLRNETALVSGHLKRAHKITIHEYHQEYSNQEGFAEKDDQISYPQRVFALPAWMNGCEYKCICGFVHSNAHKMTSHVRKSHELTDGKVPGDFYSRTLLKWHTCKLCGKAVVRDGRRISAHLHNSHKGLSTMEYSEKYCNEGQIDHTPDDKINLIEASLPSWVNKCVYSCNLCENTSNSFSCIVRHGRKVHNMAQSSYNASKGFSLTVAKYHKCMLCGVAIRNDNHHLRKHLALKHGFTFAKYNTEFSYLPDFGKDDETTVPKMRMMTWLNKCQYQCTICKTHFNSYSRLRCHGKTAHQMSQKVFKENGGFLRTKKAVHKCLICGIKTINDTATVKVHLKRAHGIHLHQYHDHYIEGSIENKEVKKSKICGAWMNRCQYQCRLCHHSCGSITMMAYHGRMAHEMPLKVYKKCGGYERTLSKYHKCRICEGEVLNDRIYLRRHFQVSHNITFLQYAEIINRENALLSWVDKC